MLRLGDKLKPDSGNRAPRPEIIIGFLAVVVAIIAWLFPFEPRSSPFPFGRTSTPTSTILSSPNAIATANFTPEMIFATATIEVGSPVSNSPLGTSVRPATYTLQQGEFPYCIAGRYNIDPNELLSLNGLINSQIVDPGMILSIPQSGNPFPGDRSLLTHPGSYSVTGDNDTSIYGVACKFGDVFPESIAQANNLSLSTTLTIGQALSIP